MGRAVTVRGLKLRWDPSGKLEINGSDAQDELVALSLTAGSPAEASLLRVLLEEAAQGTDMERRLAHIAAAAPSIRSEESVINCQDPALLALAAYSKIAALRRGVPRSPAAPAFLLEELAKDPDHQVRAQVARSPRARKTVLRQLAHDKDGRVSTAVYGNPSTPPDMLIEAARGAHAKEHCSELFRNPSLPRQALEELARHPDEEVRQRLAENTVCPVDLLVELSGDSNYLVARKAAGNPKTPYPVIEKLSHHESAWVVKQCVSRARPDILERLSSHPQAEVRHEVALYTFDPRLLTQLAHDPDDDVCEVVAGKRACPPDVLDHLASHPDVGVRQAIARNLRTQEPALLRLAKDPELWVRESIFYNDRKITPALIAIFAKDRHADIRLRIARKTDDLDLIESFVNDRAAPVRQAVARNPLITDHQLLQLARDSQWVVKDAAQSVLCNRGREL